MSRRPRSWWHGITPGGLIVTSTVAMVTLAFAASTVVLALRGDFDAAKDQAGQTAAALATLVALQARNRPDAAATIEQPATVTATQEPLA